MKIIHLLKGANDFENLGDVGATVVSLPISSAWSHHELLCPFNKSLKSIQFNWYHWFLLAQKPYHQRLNTLTEEKVPQPNRKLFRLSLASSTESGASLLLSTSTSKSPISAIPVKLLVASLPSHFGLFETVADGLSNKTTKTENKFYKLCDYTLGGYPAEVLLGCRCYFSSWSQNMDTNMNEKVCIQCFKGKKRVDLDIEQAISKHTAHFSSLKDGKWIKIYLLWNRRCFLKSGWKAMASPLISGQLVNGLDLILKSICLI